MSTKWLAIFTVWPISIIVSLWTFLLTGPWIELHLAPILVEVSVTDVYWKDDYVCWTWHWTKARPAVAISISAYFEAGGKQFNVPMFTHRDGAIAPVINYIATYPKGRADRSYCGLLPSWARAGGLQIHGVVTYDSGLWYMAQEPGSVVTPNQ